MGKRICSIKVGKSSIEKLNFDNEFEIQDSYSKKDNPEYEKKEERQEDESIKKELDVFDVLLAGVEVYD